MPFSSFGLRSPSVFPLLSILLGDETFLPSFDFGISLENEEFAVIWRIGLEGGLLTPEALRMEKCSFLGESSCCIFFCLDRPVCLFVYVGICWLATSLMLWALSSNSS